MGVLNIIQSKNIITLRKIITERSKAIIFEDFKKAISVILNNNSASCFTLFAKT